MDLDDFFMTLLEEEYAIRCEMSDVEAIEWLDNYHKTEYDTEDYCTELLNNMTFNEMLKKAILQSVCWSKIWRHLMTHIED
jgi:hypothetical protein